MTPFQQLYLGLGAKKKTYTEDVFSTYLWAGSGSARAINNGINLSSEGGMVWIKNRTNDGNKHVINDTVRGHSNAIMASESDANTTQAGLLDGFNSDGFDVSTDNFVNGSSQNYSSLTFRRASGFFDVVSYTGNGSNRTIAHSLGCVPGMIMVKRTDSSTDWRVYYRGSDGAQTLKLNQGVAAVNSASSWNSTLPTATHFSLGTQQETNINGGTFIAYLFAGGESAAATARSVELDGSDDYFQTSTGSDYTFGTGDFTIEGWFYPHSVSDKGLFMQATTGSTGLQTSYAFQCNVNTTLRYRLGSGSTSGSTTINTQKVVPMDQWSHVAFVRNSGVFSIYLNGTLADSQNDTTNYNSTDLIVGGYDSESYVFDGKISNFRVVKGTAVYTSSFRPPTAPLTSITNTVLLCCNNSSTTGTTTGTIGQNSSPSASTDSPFDDPAGFVFGENEDQNIIKCGTYTGNGSANGPEINLGWEPQLIMIKPSSLAVSWSVYDSMRGIVTGGNDPYLYPNTDVNEEVDYNQLDLTPTGFKIKSTGSIANSNGNTYFYMCIRRPDGYVGKPPKLGTDAFAMDAGAGSSTIPNFDSNFPVDFAFFKDIDTGGANWWASARLMQGKNLRINSNVAEGTASSMTFDSNVGYNKDSGAGSDHQAWMWKRSAGFDVVTYKGDAVAGRQIPHSLSKTPEFMLVKSRGYADGWLVYHKGMNGGTNPQNYYMQLQTTATEATGTGAWNDTAPTSSHFTIGNWAEVNRDGYEFITMLFASVDGISKVGYFNGSDSEQTITTGFQPRLLILRSATGNGENWYILDTTRGWASGNDQSMWLNDNAAQWAANYGAPTSTGFTLPGNHSGTNDAGQKYIYYAHA